MTVLMSESLFIQTADLFTNEASDYYLYEWVTESLTHLIRSKALIHSIMKHTVLLGEVLPSPWFSRGDPNNVIFSPWNATFTRGSLPKNV